MTVGDEDSLNPLTIEQVKMHGLNTRFSTTWFLAPYCAWLGYGE
jgi:hypothetical protein